LTPVDKWELDIGARFTSVTKEFTSITDLNNLALATNGQQINEIPLSVRRYHETNTSPEVTLNYHPTDLTSLFLSYKQGYKGPAWDLNTVSTGYAPGDIAAVKGERVEGFEGGFKADLLDHHLNITAAAYTYRYLGLQVGFFDPLTGVVTVSNGADAKTSGTELTLNYSVPKLENLVFHGYTAYDDAYYTSFVHAPCYDNQYAAGGCTNYTVVNGIQSNGFQNLTGRPLIRAPRWVGQFGADYKMDVGNNYVLSLGGQVNYSSSYFVEPTEEPLGLEKPYATIDASVHFGRSDKTWDLGLIGRNLTSKYFLTGGSSLAAVSPGVPADVEVFVARPIQIMLQLTVRPQL
jgi:outer membrane receptor protein involved in Fe transport